MSVYDFFDWVCGLTYQTCCFVHWDVDYLFELDYVRTSSKELEDLDFSKNDLTFV